MLKVLSKFRNNNTGALFSATFFFSGAHGGLFVLSIPFVVTLLGGSDKDLGLCFGLGMMSYMISCFLVAGHLDKYSAKRTLQLSSSVIAISVGLIFVIARWFTDGVFGLNPILVVTVLNVILSFMLAMFWPPMMGWVSVGHEGAELSKRLGAYNVTWSLSLVVAPIVGGYIVQASASGGMLATFLCMLTAWLFLSSTIKPEHHKSIKSTVCQAKDVEKAIPMHKTFRAMSRVGLVASCVAMALIRTQFALLFTEELGYSRSLFGIITMVFCLSNFIGFFYTVKFKNWHHKMMPFVISHVMIALGMLMIPFSKSLVMLFTAVIMVGIGQSFAYASHQFYSVSGKAKRSGSMAIHEMLISVGYTVGAIGGGYLGEVSRYNPYWMGLGVVVAAMMAEMVLFMRQTKIQLNIR